MGFCKITLKNLRKIFSEYFRNSADLKEECYVIGAYDVIELWNKEKWEKESASFDLSLEDNAAILSGFMDMIISE